jgi:Xaa-Pro aminopeptidase
MFEATIYQVRRQRLIQDLKGGLVILLGNEEVGMNYQGNPYHFRQDSTFLYFFGLQRPGLFALLDVDGGTMGVYGTDATVEDTVWTGPQKHLAELANECGVSHTGTPEAGIAYIRNAQKHGRAIHFLPPYRGHNTIWLHEVLGMPIQEIRAGASRPLIEAVVAQRAIKSEEELAQMDIAGRTTKKMHVEVMKGIRAGIREAELSALAEQIALSDGGHLAYPVILTTRGEVLHNHHHHHVLREGQWVLGDFGAEAPSGYACDITRTTLVGNHITDVQKNVYQIVLQAYRAAIAASKAGTTFQSVHLLAAQVIAEGLTEMGLMQGDPKEAVAQGAHALFFPHGLGHMIGLDVHDMEDLGEDLVGYDTETQRSDQFGLAYLRLGRRLQAGFTLTIEPGIYFIPDLIDQWHSAGKHQDFIRYDALDSFRDFGGVRLEDNFVITEAGAKILGAGIPIELEEVEQVKAEKGNE